MDSKKMCDYVRWAVFELACNAGIDHRNYDGKTRESKLKEYVKGHKDAEKAIERICVELFQDEQFNDYMTRYSNPEDDEEDDAYELQTEFFNYVVEFIGLGEISNLHGDDQDNFRDKFFLYFN